MRTDRSSGTHRAVPSSPLIATPEIWRQARSLIVQYGADAPTRAARQADAHKDAGDKRGFRNWLWVMQAATELLRDAPRPGDAVH